MKDQPIRVAIADDHDIVREGIAELICRSGKITVTLQAANGKELLQKLERANTLPDVCILDINMPEMNGYDTQLALKEEWPEIKTLVLTAHESELSIVKMIGAGAKGYLIKHASASEIEKAVIAIFNNGIYHSRIANSSLFRAVESKEIKMPRFTQPEMDVMRYCSTELTYVEIAQELNVTTRSVEGHRDSLFKKLRVNSRITLVLYGIELGLIPLNLRSNFKL